MARLTSRFLADLLIRQTMAAGGFATVVAKGDDQTGAILIQCRDRDTVGPLLERHYGPDGEPRWDATGPQDRGDGQALVEYCARRRATDPDLWIVELDIAHAPQFVVEWTHLA